MAVIPVVPMPQMSPTSRPTLSLSLTPTPTSSKLGWRSTSGITIFPTNPVPQTTTLFFSAMGSSSHPAGLFLSGSLVPSHR